MFTSPIDATSGDESSDPIAMLQRCHRSIEHFLDVLRNTLRAAGGGSLSPTQAADARAAIDYFRLACPLHNLDEEQSLFPRLRRRCNGDLLAHVDRLAADHHATLSLHEDVALLALRWIDAGLLDAVSASRLEATLSELERIYSTHVSLEEGLVFPRAAALLTAADLEAIGRELCQRRQPVTP